MSAKEIAIWSIGLSLLLIATFAWFSYTANGFAYGDVFGIPSEEAAASLFRAHALRFLALALTAEVVGVGTMVWQVLSSQSRPRRIFATIGVSVVVSVGTFALLRP
jgi:hypothetical protein